MLRSNWSKQRCSPLKCFASFFRRITASCWAASTYPSLHLHIDWRLNVELIIVIVLVLLLFGSFPVFPYSRDWGYRGSGLLGTILLIVLILWLLKWI
jgi:hypothetical protein